MRSITMKAVAGILGTIVGGMLVISPAQAAVAPAAPQSAVAAAEYGAYALHGGTGECLAADYSSVYTISCDNVPASGQYWRYAYISSDGYFKLQAAIGTCLSNLDWTRVWTTDCVTDPGTWWSWDGDRLRNWNTRYYLVADFSHRAYLNPTAGTEQSWFLY